MRESEDLARLCIGISSRKHPVIPSLRYLYNYWL